MKNHGCLIGEFEVFDDSQIQSAINEINYKNRVQIDPQSVNDILKSTHAISTIAPLVPGVGQTVGRVAGALGYGKKKKGGRSIISDEKILMIPKKGRGSHMSMSGTGLLL